MAFVLSSLNLTIVRYKIAILRRYVWIIRYEVTFVREKKITIAFFSFLNSDI